MDVGSHQRRACISVPGAGRPPLQISRGWRSRIYILIVFKKEDKIYS